MSLAGSIAKDSVRASVLTIVAKGMGFLLPVLVAYYFGASGETDAFFLAYAVPVFLNQTTIIAMNSGIVPVLAGYWTGDAGKRSALMGSLLLSCIIFFGLASVLYFFSAPHLLRLVGSRFSPGSQLLAGRFAVWLTPVIFLGGLSGLYSSVYYSKKSFTLPMLAPGFKALASTATIVLMHGQGMYAVAWGMIAGEAVQLIVLRLGLGELKFSSARRLGLDPRLKEVLFLAVPMIFVMVVNQLNVTVDKFMAAGLGTGSVSYLDYADRVYMVPLTLFGTGFLRVLLPHWSHAYARTGDMDEIKGTLGSIISTILFYMAPLALLAFLFREDVVRLFFHQGEMTMDKVGRISGVLGCFLVGFIPQVTGIVLMYVHLATRKSRVIFLASSLSLALNVLFNIIFMRFWGVNGIALSTSMVQFFFFALMFVVGHEDLRFFFLLKDRPLTSDVLKVAAGMGAMSGVWALWDVLFTVRDNWAISLASALTVTGAYLLVSYALKPGPFGASMRFVTGGQKD